MAYTYARRSRTEQTAQTKNGPRTQDAARASAVRGIALHDGHRVDLPEAMRMKMENAFGADLSALKLYESQEVGDAGAEAVARGSEIAFAPGMLDFSSYGGQALLGHEISHVVSQQRGEVTGGGFLNDHALEARADREGAMAAAGQQIAMPTAALSTASAAPAAGPMQAKKKSKEEKAAIRRQKQAKKNVDRLFRIKAAQAAGDAGAAHISKKDSAWYENMKENTDLETYTEINNRYQQSVRDLVKYRDEVQDPDRLKRNYEASWSDPALDIDLYNTICTDVAFSPGPEQFQMKLQEEDMRRHAEGNTELTEQERMDQESGKIRDANSPEVRNDRSYLFMHPEAMQDYEQRVPLRQQRYLERALPGKKGKNKKK